MPRAYLPWRKSVSSESDCRVRYVRVKSLWQFFTLILTLIISDISCTIVQRELINI